jgi:hypothetical protein
LDAPPGRLYNCGVPESMKVDFVKRTRGGFLILMKLVSINPPVGSWPALNVIPRSP